MENGKDKVLKCKECGKDFIWAFKYSSSDPVLDEEFQKFIRHINELLEEGKLEEAGRYQEALDEVNEWAINNGYSDSQEAAYINGYSSPKLCPECKRKRIEEQKSKSRGR